MSDLSKWNTVWTRATFHLHDNVGAVSVRDECFKIGFFQPSVQCTVRSRPLFRFHRRETSPCIRSTKDK